MLNQTDTIPLCTYTKAGYSNMDYFKNFALTIKKIAIPVINCQKLTKNHYNKPQLTKDELYGHYFKITKRN